MTDKEGNEPKVLSNPAWNDPPLFSYDTRLMLQQNPKRTSLTKRVVFPIETSISTCSTNQAQTFEAIVNKPPSHGISDSIVEEVTKKGEEETSLSDVIDNFNAVVIEVYGDQSERKSADVKKRLGMMETMWHNKKFDPKIKNKIFQLSKALKEGDVNKADGLQRSLMVDYSSLCSLWMSGIRFLLNSKRELQD